ncbi:hypothetical protein B1H18_01520 [Streptomyces tsukubensis]|uniref:Glycosyltransferase 2-like domain-containing protein n=1 Tax=Streptomyces tsukubensis TaxID=83656 RepID=A0A1V4AGE9_9ACTN|nr:hypothetical protein B1H18_01520 [Streptomyces tsukubensis]
MVLPVWDGYVDRRLTAAVRSIQDQGLPVGLILVDNASTVPLPAIPGTRQVHSPRRLTLGASRNLGLGHVSTPYVLFWDADDVMPAGTLRHLRSILEDDASAVAVATAMHHPVTGRIYPFPPRWAYAASYRGRLFALLNTVRPLFPGLGSVLMRTESVRECGGYDDADHGEDWAFTSVLAFRGRVRLTRRSGRAYLASPTSLSSVHRSVAAVWARRCRVRRRLRADPSVPGYCKRCLPLIAVLQCADVLVFRVLRQLGQKARGTATGPVLTNSRGRAGTPSTEEVGTKWEN